MKLFNVHYIIKKLLQLYYFKIITCTKIKINTFNNSFIVLPFFDKTYSFTFFFVKKFILLLKYILCKLFNVYYHYKIMTFMIHVPRKTFLSIKNMKIK
jgi:hypothetical protein